MMFLGGSAFASLGGIQTFNRTLLSALARNEYLQSGFLTNEERSSFPELLKDELSGGSGSKLALLNWAVKHVLRPTDLILTDHLNYSPILLANIFARKKVVTLHAYEMELPISSLRLKALKRMDAYICVSEYSKRLGLALGLDEKKMHVCYHGLDIELGAVRKDAFQVPTILFVGRLDRHYKGHDHLIEASAIMKNQGVKFKMVFAGGGQRLEDFRNQIAIMGLQSYVDFRGFVSDEELKTLYATADVFALPSSGEGFGLVYLEAMAHSLPCLAVNAGAAPEVVLDQETGVCVEYGDVDAIAKALQKLIEDTELRVKLGKNGRLRYEQHFTLSAFEERLSNLFNEIRIRS